MTEITNIEPFRIQQEIEARVRSAQSRLAPRPDTERDKAAGMAQKLTDNGYPLRAVRELAVMRGAALTKAQEKMPLMMEDGILLLIGPTGRGKTVMATWWGMQRVAAGKSCGKFATAYQIFARMKQCWTKGEDSEAVLKMWKESKFLIIDEIQTRGESVWENSVLDELINSRYAAMRPTVMIGNIEPGKEQEMLGARIVDRARECGSVVNCNWPSYRA